MSEHGIGEMATERRLKALLDRLADGVEWANERGPNYQGPVPQGALRFTSGHMRQALPSQEDLRSAMASHGRVVGGYEILADALFDLMGLVAGQAVEAQDREVALGTMLGVVAEARIQELEGRLRRVAKGCDFFRTRFDGKLMAILQLSREDVEWLETIDLVEVVEQMDNQIGNCETCGIAVLADAAGKTIGRDWEEGVVTCPACSEEGGATE